MVQLRATTAVIDLKNLIHNVQQFQALLPKGQFFCPMVKADAYGHGAVAVSRCLEGHGIKFLGVSLIEEGLALRQAGIKTDVLTFGLFDRGGNEIIEAGLTPVLSTFEQLQVMAKAAKSLCSVHVKIDTGMGRLGFSPAEVDKVVAFCEKNPQLKIAGVLTHLHSGEDAGQGQGITAQQLRLLRELGAQFKKWQPVFHVWNTAGLLALRDQPSVLKEFGARPGLGLYGVSTSPHPVALKPVMSLRSKVAKLNSLSVGQTVSYGATWKAQEPSIVGVVPIGYADGVHRILSNVGKALVKGQLVPIAGRVCMDYVMLDLTSLRDQNLLDAEVTFFGVDSNGREYSALEVANLAQTAPWEIFTSISERVPREFVGGPS